VDVELRYDRRELYLRVRDNGPGPAAAAGPEGGHGLLGMRERAAAVGGTLRSGPAAGGGFLIEARLPATAEEVA
jgi:signal transduction histidine kinase